MKCPNCHHEWSTATPKPKPKPISETAADTSSMSDTELYAYYKRTSHVADVRFFRDHCAHELIARQADSLYGMALSGELNKAETIRRLVNLQDHWRRRTS